MREQAVYDFPEALPDLGRLESRVLELHGLVERILNDVDKVTYAFDPHLPDDQARCLGRVSCRG